MEGQAMQHERTGRLDRGDEYVTKLTPLTDDIDAVYGELKKLTADGGGDWPESVNEALDAETVGACGS